MNTANAHQVEVCSLSVSPMHLAQNCLSLSPFAEYPLEQVNAFNEYKKPTSGPFNLQFMVVKPPQFLLEAKSTTKSRRYLYSSSQSISSWFPSIGLESVSIILLSPALLFNLPVKCHNLYHSHHWKTRLKHSCKWWTKPTCSTLKPYKSLRIPL